MSEEFPKSWIGMFDHVSFALFCVTFRELKSARKNFDFIYLIQFSASNWESKDPMLINVCVWHEPGSAISGVLSISPKAPVPFAPEISNLYLFVYSLSFIKRLEIHFCTRLLCCLP